MGGAQRPAAHPRDPGADPADHLLDRALVERGERPVRRTADLVVRLEPDEHQLPALGAEVDLADVVDDDREIRRPPGRQAEVGGVVAPGLDRHVETDRPGELGRPGAGDVDHDRRRERSPLGRHADHPLALDEDRLDPAALDQAGAPVAGRRQEAGRGAGRIGIPGLGLMGGRDDVVGHDPRQEAGHLVGPDDAGRDPDPLVDRDVRPEVLDERGRDELDEPGPDEPAVARPDQLRPVAEVRERGPGQARLGLEVVVHPHEARRAPGRPARDRPPLEDEDAHPAPGEVEGEAGALDAGPDDDDIGGLGHSPMMTQPRPASAAGPPPGRARKRPARGRSAPGRRGVGPGSRQATGAGRVVTGRPVRE